MTFNLIINRYRLIFDDNIFTSISWYSLVDPIGLELRATKNNTLSNSEQLYAK